MACFCKLILNTLQFGNSDVEQTEVRLSAAHFHCGFDNTRLVITRHFHRMAQLLSHDLDCFQLTLFHQGQSKPFLGVHMPFRFLHPVLLHLRRQFLLH